MSEETKDMMEVETEIEEVCEETEVKTNKFVSFVKNHKKDLVYMTMIVGAGIAGYKLGVSHSSFQPMTSDEVNNVVELVSDVVEDIAEA